VIIQDLKQKQDIGLVESGKMIQLTISKEGTQTLTEICDTCKCHVRNLTTDDILVKKDTDLIIKNSKGEEVNNTEARPPCYCEHCEH